MSQILVCEVCPKPDDLNEDKRFRAPYDEIGVALMQEHLRQDHGYSRSVQVIPKEPW